MHWQPAEAVEPVFVLLVFLLQTIIKAVWHRQFSHHNYLHANSMSSVGRQIISLLIWSTANCHNFLKKTLLFMRKLLSANWGVFFKNLAQTSRQNHAFIIYFHGIISFSLKMTAFSQESPIWFFFLSETRQTRKQKNVETFGAEKSCWFLLFPLWICINVLTHMHCKHSCRELWPHWEQNPVHCYKAGLKQWSENDDLKWKHRMDGSRIAVGFMPYYAGAVILWTLLLRLEMKAACGKELCCII